MESLQILKQEFPRPTLKLEEVRNPEDILKAVDFNVLNDIFDRISAKSKGTEPVTTSGHKVTPENVTFNVEREEAERNIKGSADIRRGKIYLVSEEKKRNSDFNMSDVLDLLTTLMHESAHVRGGYSHKSFMKNSLNYSDWKVGHTVRSGLSQTNAESSNIAGRTIKRAGLSLNEAVTENISHDVLHEYLTRTGNSTLLHDLTLSRDLEVGEYLQDRLFLAFIIEALSVRLEVHRDEIWKGFVQAYMSGNTDIHVLLDEIDAELGNTRYIQEIADIGADKSLSDASVDSYKTLLTHVKSEIKEAILKQIKMVLDVERFEDVLRLR